MESGLIFPIKLQQLIASYVFFLFDLSQILMLLFDLLINPLIQITWVKIFKKVSIVKN